MGDSHSLCRIRAIAAAVVGILGLVSQAGPEPSGLSTVALRGDVDAFWLEFQGRPVRLPPLQIWVTESGEPDDGPVSFEASPIGAAPPVRFLIRGPDEELVAGWNFSLLGAEGHALDRQSGTGPPPETLIWDSGGRPLAAGTLQATLGIVLHDGTEVQAAPVVFGLSIPAEQIELPLYPASLRVNGVRIPLGDEADQASAMFALELPKGDVQALLVEFTQANGRTVSALLDVVAPLAPVPVVLSGNALTGQLRLFDQSLGLPLVDLDIELLLAPEPVELRPALGLVLVPGGLSRPAVFRVSGDTSDIESWSLTILDPAGQVTGRLTGIGAPFEAIPWDTRDERDRPALSPGWYSYRLSATHRSGARAQTGAKTLAVLVPGSEEIWPADELFGRADNPRPTQRLDTRLAELLRRLEPDGSAIIQIHTDSRPGPEAAMRRTEAQARALHETLRRANARAGQVELLALGAEQPLVPNTAARNRTQNRRLVVTVAPALPDIPPLAPLASAPGLRIGTTQVAIDEQGEFRFEQACRPGQELELRWIGPGGQRVEWSLRLPGPELAPLVAAPRSGS